MESGKTNGSVNTYARSAHYQLVGIGAGPANLSLASLLYSQKDLSCLFIEQKKEFTWHDDQMIEGATLQVSIFKDLVTLSDPKSPFTFLAYLHENGKIYHFLNAQFAEVPRREFRNYMAWAAEKNPNIVFGEQVVSIDFDGVFYITTNRRTITADNISVGVGTVPWMPEYAKKLPDSAHFHISQYVQRGKQLTGKDVAIVGGGQSGAEIFLDLISRPIESRPKRIKWISRRRNFFPIDDSAFTNDFFMPCYSDYFNSLPEALRDSTTTANILTSDGISESTIRAIYQKLYYNRFVEQLPCKFELYPNRSVQNITEAELGSDSAVWRLKIKHNDVAESAEHLDAEVIIWATGFSPAPKSFLSPLTQRITQINAEFLIDNDYAAQWDGPSNRQIFMQNAARGQRGLPDVNLSLNAWRAQKIVSRLTGKSTELQHSSFINWASSHVVPPAVLEMLETEVEQIPATEI